MGRNASSMGFARAPQRQFFASRPAMMPRPRSAFVPQRRNVDTFGHINGGPFFRTRGFDGRFNDGFHHFHHRRSFVFVVPYYGAYGSSYYGDYGYPYYAGGSYSSDPAANAGYYADLSNQMSQLDSEVQQLRNENDSLQSALEEQRRPAAPASSAATKSTNEPATVIAPKSRAMRLWDPPCGCCQILVLRKYRWLISTSTKPLRPMKTAA